MTEFDTIEDAIREIKAGRMIILVDDEDRENEGDICCAAEYITPEAVNFMAKYARGLICLTLTEEQTARLQLPMMTTGNRSPFHTNFTVSIEAASGVTTGISAADRAHTILTAAHPNARPDDIVVPGHIFPLRARPGGVLQRAGQTEGSVDLSRLAGLNPAGVICEIMNDDGTMARYAELKAFSRKHNLKMVTIKDLIEYRLNKEKQVSCLNSSKIQTRFGEFNFYIYRNIFNQELYLAFVSGDPAQDDPASVRVHSAYPPSDLLTEIMQGESLVTKGLKYIQAHPPGIFLYVMKEVTSAQTAAKIESLLAPQSVKAEQSAPPEERMLREYGFGAQVIRDLGFRKLQVLTSHPRQIIGLDAYGLEVCKTIPM